MISTIQILQIVHAIYLTEGGPNTHFPYGIKSHYVHTTPKQACINTVQHFIVSNHYTTITREMISSLSNKYCPPSDDPISNKNWKINMNKILHL